MIIMIIMIMNNNNDNDNDYNHNTYAALCIFNADASLRIWSTDASGCFFTNVTFTAVAEIGIRGKFCQKLSEVHWVQLVFHSSYLILNWRSYTFLHYISVKCEYRIPFMIWKLQTTFSNVSSMKVFEFRLQFHWSSEVCSQGSNWF